MTDPNIVKEVTVQELKKMMDDKTSFQLIDVREPDEYQFCNLSGINIPLSNVLSASAVIADDKPVIIHCRSGARSANAILQLQNAHGFENLYNLKGGIVAWAREIDPEVPVY